MKPIRLTISAFLSYGQKQVIDFEKLGNTGLFLISGNTGSGKTAIFDALVFALYGKSCSEDRSADMLRSDCAAPDSETYVELEFEIDKRRYRIKRSPKYERKKKTGTGTVTKNATVEFDLPDGTVLSKTREADARISEILGLGPSQFRQVALLAQGAFQDILKADTVKRTEILRSLFKTERFQELQERLKQKYSEAKKEYDTNQQLITQVRKNIQGYEEEIFSLEHFQDYIAREKVQIDQGRTALTGQRDWQAKLNREIGSLEEQNKVWNLANEAKEQLALWEPKMEAEQKTVADLEKRSEQIEEKKKKVQILEQQIEAGRRKGVLQKEIKNLSDTLHKEQESCSKQQEILLETASKLKEDQDLLLKLADIPLQADQISKTEQMFLELNKVLRYENQLEKELAEKTKQYDEARKNYLNLENEENQKRRSFLSGQAGILAKSLQEGEPCPVCGSIHHPSPAILCEHTPTQQEVDQAQEKVTRARKKLDSSFENLSELKNVLDSQKSKAETIRETLPEGMTMDQLETQKKEIAQKQKLRTNVQAELKKLEDQQKKAEQIFRENEEKVKQTREALNTRTGRLEAIDFPFESLEQALEQKQILEQMIKNWNTQLTNHKKLLDQARSKTALAKGQLKSFEDQSLQDVSELLKDKIQARSDLEKELQQLERKLEIQQAVLIQNQKAWKQLKDLEQSASIIQAKAGSLEALSKAFNGSQNVEGQGRIDMETYVLGKYFDKVVAKANHRFKIMSDGRYELKRSKTGSGRSKAGLDLDIHDHYTGKIRSADGLSGGESFQASLSLALGLSDAIQEESGGTMLETLFVDEGFGTLDGEALNKAVRTLNELAGSRLVGIISHVDSLQDEIDKQIRVSIDQSGCSKAKMYV